MTTRAVVLARGLGTRMRAEDPAAPLTDAQRRAADAGLKAMMPVEGRPFLDFVLGSLADAGITTAGLIVAPDHADLRSHYTRTPPARLALDFIVQPDPIGTANAVLAAEAWAGLDPFLTLNADNLYPVTVLKALAALDEPGLPGFDRGDLVRSGNIAPDRVASFAFVQTDDAGYLTEIVEKPSAGAVPARGLVSMNCWRFDARIFDACRAVPRSARGEFELPQAVGCAAAQGVRFRVLPVRGPVLDLSRRGDAAEVSRRLAGIDPRP